ESAERDTHRAISVPGTQRSYPPAHLGGNRIPSSGGSRIRAASPDRLGWFRLHRPERIADQSHHGIFCLSGDLDRVPHGETPPGRLRHSSPPGIRTKIL